MSVVVSSRRTVPDRDAATAALALPRVVQSVADHDPTTDRPDVVFLGPEGYLAPISYEAGAPAKAIATLDEVAVEARRTPDGYLVGHVGSWPDRRLGRARERGRCRSGTAG